MRHADYAWTVLAAAVVAYELLAYAKPEVEYLSEAMDRYRQRHPIVTNTGIIYLALHLLRRLPSYADPLARMGR